MKVVCAWCQRELGQKPPYDDPAVSHGICEPCAKGLEEEMSQRKVLTHREALEAAEALVEHEREGIKHGNPRRYPEAGSREAREWAEKMRLAKQRKARELRASGRFREFEYFSPGGIMEEAEKHKRAKHNPGMKEAVTRTLDFIKENLRAPYVAGYVSTLGGAEQASILLTVSLDPESTWANGIIENSRYAKFHIGHDGVIEQISGYGVKRFRKSRAKDAGGILDKLTRWVTESAGGKSNPDPQIGISEALGLAKSFYGPSVQSVAWKPDMSLWEIYGVKKKYTRLFLDGDGMTIREFGTKGWQTFPLERHGWKKKLRKNPLAIYGLANPGREHGKFRRCVKKVRGSLRKYGRSGSPERICGAALNPPGEVHATIAGVVYNRCLEIRAEKTGYSKGLYKHPFARKSGVQILALDNGDLLIHSTHGVRLWKRA